MVHRRRERARLWIVAGVIVVATASIIQTTVVLGNGVVGILPVKVLVQELLYPLASVADVYAWWYLSKLFLTQNDHHSLTFRALLGLALQSVLLCAVYALSVDEPLFVSWAYVARWLFVIGTVGETIGFGLMMRSYATRPLYSRFALAYDESLVDDGANVPLESLDDELGES